MKYVDDTALGYERIRWSQIEGASLELDVNYRTMHLPLLNPEHPDVVTDGENEMYQFGRYDETRYSLVLPIAVTELENSPTFRKIDSLMGTSAFTEKIAWDVMERRRGLLHATICGGLPENDLSQIIRTMEYHFIEHGPLSFRLGGPLIGEKNMGRIYFPVFPEDKNGQNAFNRLQDAVGKPCTDIFLVGYYSLLDHLNAQETADLAVILESFATSTLLESVAEEVWLLATNDDLVLSGKIKSIIKAR